MTLREKAICEIYTDCCFCSGDERKEVYVYLEELTGRPVYTHELADTKFREELKGLVLSDFIKVCNGTYSGGGSSANEYQKEALRTEAGMDHTYPRILNGLMGLNGEAGECIDILKKHLFQGHDVDAEHLAKELGDVAWYLAVSADAIGYDLQTIFDMNVEKLRKRYPRGFEAEKSMNRVEGDV